MKNYLKVRVEYLAFGAFMLFILTALATEVFLSHMSPRFKKWRNEYRCGTDAIDEVEEIVEILREMKKVSFRELEEDFL